MNCHIETLSSNQGCLAKHTLSFLRSSKGSFRELTAYLNSNFQNVTNSFKRNAKWSSYVVRELWRNRLSGELWLWSSASHNFWTWYGEISDKNLKGNEWVLKSKNWGHFQNTSHRVIFGNAFWKSQNWNENFFRRHADKQAVNQD